MSLYPKNHIIVVFGIIDVFEPAYEARFSLNMRAWITALKAIIIIAVGKHVTFPLPEKCLSTE